MDVPPDPNPVPPAPARASRLGLGLLAVGLVVAGLLGGVLATLWWRPAPAPLVVDRPVRPAAAVDTARGADAPIDLVAMNVRFRDVAARAKAAVVFVQVDPRTSAQDWLRRINPGAPEGGLRLRQDIGSGVITSAEGYIVTNHHVVQNAGDVTVTLPDRRQFEAEVVGFDRATDLAVLKIPATPDLPILPIGNSDALEVGEWVLAVGNPFRLTSTVTAGIVSALGRRVNIIDDAYSIEDFIQTDAAINPGNSGGALVNLKGELVGISTAIATESGTYEGYGFAVPSNLVTRIAQDLVERGEVERGVLGVTLRELTPRLAERLGLARADGVVLADVPAGGAAYRAGLRAGDVVTGIGGRPVNAVNELQGAVARFRVGQSVTVDVVRDGRTRRFAVPLMVLREHRTSPLDRFRSPAPEVPPDDEALSSADRWGVAVRDLTRGETSAFDAEGAYVARIREGSPADFAGLPRDVVIVAVEDAPVASADEAAEALDAAGEAPVLLRVRTRDGTTAFYELLPADGAR